MGGITQGTSDAISKNADFSDPLAMQRRLKTTHVIGWPEQLHFTGKVGITGDPDQQGSGFCDCLTAK